MDGEEALGEKAKEKGKNCLTSTASESFVELLKNTNAMMPKILWLGEPGVGPAKFRNHHP